MNSGFGAVTSYSAVQLALEEQKILPPILLKLTPLAFALAGLPPVTSAGHGVFSADAVQEPRLEVQFFQVTELISPVTAPAPPSLVVFPLIVDSVQVTVTKPDDIVDLVPGTSWV